jgi:glycosyltransferase involved in cell wall biosynthesis
MTETPLVSIVTPSFNQADYLEETILSVLRQDYPNLEYFVVDGGSTDGSVEIIKKYAGQLAWWVSEPDQGQADAINKGLRRAKGEIVAWLNSDDLYLSGTIQRAVEVMQKNPDLGLVYGNLHSINPRGEHVNTITYQQYTLQDLLAFRIIGQPAVFMRRAVLEKAGYLDLNYSYLLDHHLWIRMAALGELKYVPEDWAAGRIHPQAKNVAQAPGFGREALKVLAWAEHEPGLAEIIKIDQKYVWAGAHRLNARYLLDGGLAKESLREYWLAFKYQPGYALKHWHRIIFAVLSLLGLSSLHRLVGKRYE